MNCLGNAQQTQGSRHFLGPALRHALRADRAGGSGGATVGDDHNPDRIAVSPVQGNDAAGSQRFIIRVRRNHEDATTRLPAAPSLGIKA
jgi:hypothetical protein